MASAGSTAAAAGFVPLFEPSRIASWPKSYLNAWENRKSCPGLFLFHFTVCGAKRVGEFTDSERKSLLDAVEDLGSIQFSRKVWGLIANNVAGALRTGEQCRGEVIRLALCGHPTAAKLVEPSPKHVVKFRTTDERQGILKRVKRWVAQQEIVAKAALGTSSANRNARIVNRCLEAKASGKLPAVKVKQSRPFKTIQKHLFGKSKIPKLPSTNVTKEIGCASDTEEEVVDYGGLQMSSTESESSDSEVSQPIPKVSQKESRKTANTKQTSEKSDSDSNSDNDHIPLAMLYRSSKTKNLSHHRVEAPPTEHDNETDFDKASRYSLSSSDESYTLETRNGCSNEQQIAQQTRNFPGNDSAANRGYVKEVVKRKHKVIFSDDSEDSDCADRVLFTKRIARASVSPRNRKAAKTTKGEISPTVIPSSHSSNVAGSSTNDDSANEGTAFIERMDCTAETATDTNEFIASSDEEFLHGWDDDLADFPHSMSKEEFHQMMKRDPKQCAKDIVKLTMESKTKLSDFEAQLENSKADTLALSKLKYNLKNLLKDKMDPIRVLLTRLENAQYNDAKLMLHDAAYRELDERYNTIMKAIQSAKESQISQSPRDDGFMSSDDDANRMSQHSGTDQHLVSGVNTFHTSRPPGDDPFEVSDDEGGVSEAAEDWDSIQRQASSSRQHSRLSLSSGKRKRSVVNATHNEDDRDVFMTRVDDQDAFVTDESEDQDMFSTTDNDLEVCVDLTTSTADGLALGHIKRKTSGLQASSTKNRKSTLQSLARQSSRDQLASQRSLSQSHAAATSNVSSRHSKLTLSKIRINSGSSQQQVLVSSHQRQKRRTRPWQQASTVLPTISNVRQRFETLNNKIKDLRHGTMEPTVNRLTPVQDQVQKLQQSVESVLHNLRFANSDAGSVSQLRDQFQHYHTQLENATVVLKKMHNVMEQQESIEQYETQNQNFTGRSSNSMKVSNPQRTIQNSLSPEDHLDEWDSPIGEVSTHAIEQLRSKPHVVTRRSSDSSSKHVNKAPTSEMDRSMEALVQHLADDSEDEQQITMGGSTRIRWSKMKEGDYKQPTDSTKTILAATPVNVTYNRECGLLSATSQLRNSFVEIEKYCTGCADDMQDAYDQFINGLRSIQTALSSKVSSICRNAVMLEVFAFIANPYVSSIAIHNNDKRMYKSCEALATFRCQVHTIILESITGNKELNSFHGGRHPQLGLKQYCVILMHDLFVACSSHGFTKYDMDDNCLFNGHVSQLWKLIILGLDTLCGHGTSFWSVFTLMVNTFNEVCPKSQLTALERYQLLDAVTSQQIWDVFGSHENPDFDCTEDDQREQHMVDWAELVWRVTFPVLGIWTTINGGKHDDQLFDWELLSLLLRSSPLMNPRFKTFSWISHSASAGVDTTYKGQVLTRQLFAYCNEILHRSLLLCQMLSPNIFSITQLWHGLLSVSNQITASNNTNKSSSSLFSSHDDKFWDEAFVTPSDSAAFSNDNQTSHVRLNCGNTQTNHGPDAIILQFLYLVRSQMQRVTSGPKAKRLASNLLELVPKVNDVVSTKRYQHDTTVKSSSGGIDEPSSQIPGSKCNTTSTRPVMHDNRILSHSALKLSVAMLTTIAANGPKSQLAKIARALPSLIDLENSDVMAQAIIARAATFLALLFQERGIAISSSPKPVTQSINHDDGGKRSINGVLQEVTMPGDIMMALAVRTCSDFKAGHDALSITRKELEQLEGAKKTSRTSIMTRGKASRQRFVRKPIFVSKEDEKRLSDAKRKVSALQRLQHERPLLVQYIIEQLVKLVRKYRNPDSPFPLHLTCKELDVAVPIVNAVLGSARVQKSHTGIVVQTLSLMEALLSTAFPYPSSTASACWPMDELSCLEYFPPIHVEEKPVVENPNKQTGSNQASPVSQSDDVIEDAFFADIDLDALIAANETKKKVAKQIEERSTMLRQIAERFRERASQSTNEVVLAYRRTLAVALVRFFKPTAAVLRSWFLSSSHVGATQRATQQQRDSPLDSFDTVHSKSTALPPDPKIVDAKMSGMAIGVRVCALFSLLGELEATNHRRSSIPTSSSLWMPRTRDTLSTFGLDRATWLHQRSTKPPACNSVPFRTQASLLYYSIITGVDSLTQLNTAKSQISSLCEAWVVSLLDASSLPWGGDVGVSQYRSGIEDLHYFDPGDFIAGTRVLGFSGVLMSALHPQPSNSAVIDVMGLCEAVFETVQSVQSRHSQTSNAITLNMCLKFRIQVLKVMCNWMQQRWNEACKKGSPQMRSKIQVECSRLLCSCWEVARSTISALLKSPVQYAIKCRQDRRDTAQKGASQTLADLGLVKSVSDRSSAVGLGSDIREYISFVYESVQIVLVHCSQPLYLSTDPVRSGLHQIVNHFFPLSRFGVGVTAAASSSEFSDQTLLVQGMAESHLNHEQLRALPNLLESLGALGISQPGVESWLTNICRSLSRQLFHAMRSQQRNVRGVGVTSAQVRELKSVLVRLVARARQKQVGVNGSDVIVRKLLCRPTLFDLSRCAQQQFKEIRMSPRKSSPLFQLIEADDIALRQGALELLECLSDCMNGSAQVRSLALLAVQNFNKM